MYTYIYLYIYTIYTCINYSTLVVKLGNLQRMKLISVETLIKVHVLNIDIDQILI